MSFRAFSTAALLTAVLLTGCGEEEAEPAAATAAPKSEAVEAHEQNAVELDGIRYRVMIFRQLNPRIAPDKALYDGSRPEGDRGIYAAFLEACNVSEEAERPAERIRLEDAFGESYPRLKTASATTYDYEPVRLRPGECLPSDDSAADRAFPGAAALFAIPFDRLGNRPFVLELHDGAVRRIELDL